MAVDSGPRPGLPAALGPARALPVAILLLLTVACQPGPSSRVDDEVTPGSPEEAGAGFRIDPVRPIAELRAEALAASPPTEEGDFRERGYGLLVFDAYRPWHVTKMFWEATPERQRDFVADPAAGSRHNRGAAVDLTLYDLETGGPVPMPSGYDEFTERASPDYAGGTASQRRHRDLLRAVMESEGFEVYEHEWWHFDHRDWRRYPILDLTFEELATTTGESGPGNPGPAG